MAKNKTTDTENSVIQYLDNINNKRDERIVLRSINLISTLTGFEPKMWGISIAGFGSYHYKYASGHEGDAPLAGLASRSNAITFVSCI